VKISEIIVESKPMFKLNEVGMAHAEDIIFYEGSAGALRVLESLKNLPKTRDKSLTIKWDGQVALFAGRDENGTFIMTDMAGWGAKGYNGLYTSSKEFIAQKVSKGGDPASDFLMKIKALWPIMETAFPAGYRGFVKGDVMWWPGNLQDNGKFYLFGEGTTKYEIDKTTDLGRRVGQGRAGFAVHGFCPTTNDKMPEPLKTTAGLNLNGQLCVLGPEIKVEGDVQIDKSKFDSAIKLIKHNTKLVDSFLDVNLLKENKMAGLPDMLYAFVNSQTKLRDLENLDNKFAGWVQSNPKLSKPMVIKVLEYIKANSSSLSAIFRIFEAIVALKLDIIHQLDVGNKGVYAHINGERGGEGYVLYDEGGYIKLVSRTHFSSANFGNHI
jgi:hypothetical protein